MDQTLSAAQFQLVSDDNFFKAYWTLIFLKPRSSLSANIWHVFGNREYFNISLYSLHRQQLLQLSNSLCHCGNVLYFSYTILFYFSTELLAFTFLLFPLPLKGSLRFLSVFFIVRSHPQGQEMTDSRIIDISVKGTFTNFSLPSVRLL